jgi:DnaK suppressor protein
LTNDMNRMMRDVRTRSSHDRDAADAQDGPSADTRDDLDLALIQMKAETLVSIEAALQRLQAGVYGNCIECMEAISSERLRALPFAVRCTSCEDAREKGVDGTPRPPARRTSYSSFDHKS